MHAALKVALIALSLSLDVFAVCVGVGMRGVTAKMRWRIGLAFASAEVLMNLLGVGLGAVTGRLLGDFAGDLGFIALIGVGLYMCYESAHRDDDEKMDLSSGWPLFVASLSISLDSLGIGFSLAYIGVPIPVSLSAIFACSIAATAAGLYFGRRLGAVVESRAELFGGVLLTLTGVIFLVGKALHWG